MLTLHDGNPGLNRRQFLRVGGLGLGGLSLSSLLAAKAAAEPATNLLTGKSVIFLFQQGGPSQFETFDPKMDVPAEIRTVTGSVQTSLPGVRFGDTMQQLARLANKLTIVRSFQTGNAGHNIHPIVSADSLNANIGSLYSRVAGSTRANGMPTNAVLFNHVVAPDVVKGNARGDIASTGTLGTVYAPFMPGAGGELQKSMKLNLPTERFDDRRALLGQLNQLQKQFDSDEQLKDVDKFQDQAVQLLLSGGVANAFDLSKEDPKTVAKYDTSKFAHPDGWSKAARGKRGYYTGHAKSLGKLLLLARRLCEAGCGFVTIHEGYEGVWDFHADGNNLNCADGMEAIGRSTDHAIAAFIEDLEARGLSEKILLIATGEMGRTPKLNKNGGRDHWARLAPLLMYGGGIGGGKVIGQSTRDGGEPAADPLGVKHLVSTVLHTMFDVGQLRLLQGVQAVAKLGEHQPMPGMF